MRRLADDGELKAELGSTLVLHTEGEAKARRIVLAGVGKRSDVNADALRTAASAVTRRIADVGGTVAWLLDDSLPLGAEDQTRAIVEGTVIGSYDPARWKTDETPKHRIEKVVLCTSSPDGLSDTAARTATVGAWVNAARDLANSPPNELTPQVLAERAKELAGPNLTVESLDPSEIDEHGMGALSAVGRASANGPRLIVLRYDPPGGSKSDVVLGLVGKAITFDAGGISLKPALKMEDMKGDMAGGAAVIAGTAAVAELELPIRIVTVVAAAENLVSGDSFRPGDILRAANGKTIEITNTDAEGRLVLADAIWYARARARRTCSTSPRSRERWSSRSATSTRALRERRRLGPPDSRCRRVERRPCLAVPAAPALPALRRLVLRRHQELVRPTPGLAGPRGGVPQGVRRRRAVGAHRHGRPRLPRALARRLPHAARRHRLRRPLDRRARAEPRHLNFELEPGARARPLHRAEFARERVAPVAEEIDREGRFPYDLVTELGELGLMGMTIPEEYGGAGADTVSYAIAVEELTRIDSSVAITMAAHHSLGTLPIYYFGTEEQKREWLPDLTSGKKLAAFGLTEPDAGSDAGATRTRAELRDGSWVVNGSKIFITNAGTDITACVTITALTGDDEVSNIIVPNGTAGLRDLEADEEARLARVRHARALVQGLRGPRGEPARPARPGLPPVPRDPRRRPHLRRRDGRRPRAGRVRPRVRATRRSESSSASRSRRSRRSSSGSPTWRRRSRPAARWSTRPRGSRTRAATSGLPPRRRSSTPASSRTAPSNWALQIHGGYGYMDEYAISRLYRDQKILEIGEGTNEVQRMVIARRLGL